MDRKVIASKGISNSASINVYDIVFGIDDYVVAGINNQTPQKYKIYNTSKGSYFNFGGTREYLNEYMRTN